ncbi:MAG: archaeosortase/exosortase family protein [Candidatus Aenigmatarchaeota archaeon]
MRKKRRLMGLNLTARQQRLLETLVFLIKVLLLSLPIYLVIALGISLSPLQNFDAAISSGILRALGYVVSQEGAHITVGDTNPFSFYLTEDCTAWKSFILLFALIFAVPAFRLGSRIKGIMGITHKDDIHHKHSFY